MLPPPLVIESPSATRPRFTSGPASEGGGPRSSAIARRRAASGVQEVLERARRVAGQALDGVAEHVELAAGDPRVRRDPRLDLPVGRAVAGPRGVGLLDGLVDVA